MVEIKNIPALLLVAYFGLVSAQFPSQSTITGNSTNNGTVVTGGGGRFPTLPQFPVHHPQVIHFIGAGYDLIQGNPDGESWTSLGDDPGLKLTQKIMTVSPGNTPVQVEIEHRDACQSSHSYNLIYNAKQYQDRLLGSITTSGPTDAALRPYAFTLSTGYETAAHQLTQPLNYMYQDYTTMCDMGHARLRSHLAQSDHLSVTREFAASVCSLPENYQLPNYLRFIEEWGTHMITEVEVGKKITYRYLTTRDKYFSYLLANATQDVLRSTNGTQDVLTVNMNNFKYRPEYRYLVGQYHDAFGVGNPMYNDEVEMTMVTIDSILDSKYWFYLSYYISQGVCGNDATSTLPKWQANMVQALKFYPYRKSAKHPVDSKLEIPLQWPKGTYSLQKPTAGCPGTFKWSEGRIMVNMTGAQMSAMNSFEGDVEHSSFTLNYCAKERAESKDELIWSKGDYCLFQQDSDCPIGFTSSSIRYQDRVHPITVGVTPHVEYKTGAQYKYCCRSDGSYLDRIYLPTSKPFYLLKYTHGCQRVDGMEFKEQQFLYPTKQHIFIHNSPSHTTISGKGVNLDYCYYTPLKVGGGVNIGVGK
ncbi:uncharacterized protein LOC134707430 [Mytilus trossulus]|uniref:uncharacterized protein LOC134707430 n=1 Tax=Mytilus trossulus TaxID=6551 RepID=UPI0030062DFF